MKKFSDFPPVRFDGLFLLRRPVATLAALDVDRLNEAARVDLKCHVPQLLKWLNFCLKWVAAPRVEDVIDHLEQIAGTSRILADLLSKNETTANAVVGAFLAADEAEEITLLEEGDGERKIAKLRESISALADASSNAMELRSTTQGRGRRRDIFLNLLVSRVCEIYDTAGGNAVGAYHASEGEYRGPVLDLICELLTQAKNVGIVSGRLANYSKGAIAQKIIKYRRSRRRASADALERGKRRPCGEVDLKHDCLGLRKHRLNL